MPGSTPMPMSPSLPIFSNSPLSAISVSPRTTLAWLNGSVGCGTDSVVDASMWCTRALSAACSVYGLNSTGRKLQRTSTSYFAHSATTASTSAASTCSAGNRFSSPMRADAACALARS